MNQTCSPKLSVLMNISWLADNRQCHPQYFIQKVSEYDQEMPQSHTTDQQKFSCRLVNVRCMIVNSIIIISDIVSTKTCSFFKKISSAYNKTVKYILDYCCLFLVWLGVWLLAFVAYPSYLIFPCICGHPLLVHLPLLCNNKSTLTGFKLGPDIREK